MNGSSDRRQGPSKKAILKSLFLAFLLLSVAWTTKFFGGQDAQFPKSAGAVGPSPYRWSLGERATYQFSYRSSSSSDFRGLFGEVKPSSPKEEEKPSGLVFSFDTTVKGDLTLTVLEQKGDKILVAYRIWNSLVTLIANGYEDTQQAESIRTDLEKEVFAFVSPEGKIHSVLLDPSMGDLAQSYTRAILAFTQFVFPGEKIPESDPWQVQEEDPSGQYVAVYQRCRDKKLTQLKTFCKKKSHYLEEHPKGGRGPIEIPKRIVPKGEFVALFDFGGGVVSSLKGSESQTILVQNKEVGWVTNTFHVTFLRKERLKASEVASLKAFFPSREKATQPISLYVKPSPEKMEASIHQRELGEATLESLLAELKKAESASDPNFDSTPLYLKFKSLIYLHPESCKTLGRVLSRAAPNSLTMRILPKALSTIGHAQAQAALVEAIKAHSSDKAALFRLINALATVGEPTEQAEETLQDLAFRSKDAEIAAMAQLAIGAQVRRIARTSSERAAKIVDRFIAEMKKSSSPEMTKQLLLALGNAGSSRALPEISALAKSSSPDLRATALHALRFIDSPQAETLLLDALRLDLETSVRLAAANALGYREMTEVSFRAQKEIFLKDSDVTLRLKILDNLRKAEQAFPEARRLIKKAASEDPSEEVRKAAKNIMSQYPESYFQ